MNVPTIDQYVLLELFTKYGPKYKLLAARTQYGYKSGLSTTGEIVKIAHPIQTGPDTETIVLMGPSGAFGCVNRILLWAAICKTGLPINLIQHIKYGHRNTKLRCKDNGAYGPPVKNNVVVSQRYAIRALLFIIYIEDAMQDYRAMNGQTELPQRRSIQTAPHTPTISSNISNP